MYQVVKRDGKVADFQLGKISTAITKAFEATKTPYNQEIIDLLALRVTADYQGKIREDRITVEEIQDSVESVLGKAGYEEVAKAYILYRKQREKIRNLNSTVLDYKELVDNYLHINNHIRICRLPRSSKRCARRPGPARTACNLQVLAIGAP